MVLETFDPSGLQREDGLTRIHSRYGVFDLIARIEAFQARPEWDRNTGLLREAYSGLRSALLDVARSEGPYLSSTGTHLTPAYALAAAEGRAGHKPRIWLSARLNMAGNLTVTFSTRFLGADGRCHRAEEWAGSPESSYYRGERPEDEILYIQNVQELLYRPDRFSRRGDPAWRREEFCLASEAVLAAYGVTVKRLSARYHVQVGSHVVGISEQDGFSAPCLGLEIVDGLEEHRAMVEAGPADFRERFWIAPGDLWHACLAASVKTGKPDFGSVSRRLRSGGRAPGLTPGAAEYWQGRLERAVRYGLWHPPAPDERQVRQVELSRARKAASSRSMPAGRSPAEASDPRYPRKAVPLPDDIRREFDVEDGHALVALLNAARDGAGMRPIPQGDFPSNKPNLLSVTKALRAFREGAAKGGVRSASPA